MAKGRGFQFKQFYVAHDQCAMKVNTDSIILGAWADMSHCKRILDVGTGSGLLALMAAQRTASSCEVQAVEIDKKAYQQAIANFTASPWANRLTAIEMDVEQLSLPQPVDLILSNPPYFASPQKASNAYHQQTDQRQTARHESGLTLAAFFAQCQRLLSTEGSIAMVFPHERWHYLSECAADFGFSISQKLRIAATPSANPYLNALVLRRGKSEMTESSLCIRDHHQQYTQCYRTLCREFYLNF